MDNTYHIQPLRLLGGWTIEFNNFYECEPDNCNDFWSVLNEDLLKLKYTKFDLILDLGWYPNGDKEGKYVLELILNCNWKKPLEIFESRRTKEVVEKIELWTNYSFFSKYI